MSKCGGEACSPVPRYLVLLRGRQQDQVHADRTGPSPPHSLTLSPPKERGAAENDKMFDINELS